MAHAPPTRILLIRPSALGDVCRSVPVLVSLKRAFPDASIHWLVQDSFADAIRHHPDLTAVVPFARKALGRDARRLRLGSVMKWLGKLRHERYDMVIDAQGLARSAIFTRVTGARQRIGYANAAECGWIAYNTRVNAPMANHTVDRMLALAQAAGADIIPNMKLHAGPDELSDVAVEYPEPYAVLAPTSRWAAKRWPADRFTELARRLLDSGVQRIIVVGGPGERDQCPELIKLAADHPRLTDRIGTTTIGQLMAIIARSKLVVANDSAALHMAVGFDRPMVGLFGPTDIARVGPYRRDADVIQHITPADSLDHKADASVALMERITVDEVAAACTDRLA